MSVVSFLFRLLALSTFFSCLLVSVLIYLPLRQFEPVVYDLPLCPPFEGPYADNDRLSKAVKLFENELAGAESIGHHNGKCHHP